jgi:1-acyl-sn-glycerol-3-phosphate acyltransferase
MRLRKFFTILFTVLFRIFTRVKVINPENIPREGGVIVAANHLGIIDAPLMFLLLDRSDSTGLVAKKHRKNPLLRWIVEGAGGIWLNRDEPDSQAVRAARKHLQNGGLLGIAPEGTRSKTGQMAHGKTGVAYLADKAGVPIVPVAITGTQHAIKRILSLRKVNIVVQFGKAFRLPPVSREARDLDLKCNTDEIMCQIAVMLPPEQRGVFADHPRVQELLNEKEIFLSP